MGGVRLLSQPNRISTPTDSSPPAVLATVHVFSALQLRCPLLSHRSAPELASLLYPASPSFVSSLSGAPTSSRPSSSVAPRNPAPSPLSLSPARPQLASPLSPVRAPRSSPSSSIVAHILAESMGIAAASASTMQIQTWPRCINGRSSSVTCGGGVYWRNG